MQADLVIVGAGMVGSTLALALAGSGLSILVVDAGALEVPAFEAAAPFEPRVSALSMASQRILERVGAWPGIVSRRACRYTDMRVWDGSGTADSLLRCVGACRGARHIVENRVVQDALLDALRAGGEIELLGNASLQTLERDGTAGRSNWPTAVGSARSWWSRPMARNRRCVVWRAARRANGITCTMPS